MKICRLCRHLYDDDTYNFCLNDGSVLEDDSNPERTELLQRGDISDNSQLTEIATRIRPDLNPLEKTVGVNLSFILADINQELLKAKFDENEIKAAFQISSTILIKGLQAIARRLDPVKLSENLRQAMKNGAALIDESKQLNGKNKVFQLALTAYPDRKIAEMFTAALSKVGMSNTDSEAALVIELGQAETTLEFVQGLLFDKGYFRSQFETEFNPEPVVMDYPNILLVDGKLTRAEYLFPIIRKLSQSLNPNLLVIAEDAEEAALGAISREISGKSMKAVTAKSPGFGERRRAMLQDIAIVTGARVFVGDDYERHLSTAATDDLGRAGKAVITPDTTIIVGAYGNTTAIAARIEEIKREIEETDSDYDRGKLTERLARLAGGAAVIRVGGHSELERQEGFDLFNRVLRDCLWGIAFGCVAGNHLTLINAANVLRQQGLSDSGEQREANLILADALETPFELMISATGRNGAEVLESVRLKQSQNNNFNIGYDIEKDEVTDLVKAGVIVPRLLVTRICEAAVYLAARKLAIFRYTDKLVREMEK